MTYLICLLLIIGLNYAFDLHLIHNAGVILIYVWNSWIIPMGNYLAVWLDINTAFPMCEVLTIYIFILYFVSCISSISLWRSLKRS